MSNSSTFSMPFTHFAHEQSPSTASPSNYSSNQTPPPSFRFNEDEMFDNVIGFIDYVKKQYTHHPTQAAAVMKDIAGLDDESRQDTRSIIQTFRQSLGEDTSEDIDILRQALALERRLDADKMTAYKDKISVLEAKLETQRSQLESLPSEFVECLRSMRG
jgi:hypothetical protein